MQNKGDSTLGNHPESSSNSKEQDKAKALSPSHAADLWLIFTQRQKAKLTEKPLV